MGVKLNEMKDELETLKTLISEETEKMKILEENIKAEELKIKEKNKDKCIEICLDAIIVGASGLTMHHGSIAPYTHGYYINDRNSLVDKSYCNSVYSNEGFEDIAKNLYEYFCNKKNWTYDDFKALKKESDKLWKKLPEAYTPDYYVPDRVSGKSDYILHGNYIANGYEDNGFADIVNGRCYGTYSSYTTTTECELARELIVLKGFCPDGLLDSKRPEFKRLVEKVYKRHGIDSDLSDLDAWAKRNPTRCMSNKDCFISKEQLQEKNKDDLDR